jgi:hypothetical protein
VGGRPGLERLAPQLDGDQSVGGAIGVGRDPVEDDGADARPHIRDLGGELGKCRIADVPVAVDVTDEDLRVGARGDAGQARSCACRNPASSARYSATTALATPIASARAARRAPSEASIT